MSGHGAWMTGLAAGAGLVLGLTACGGEPAEPAESAASAQDPAASVDATPASESVAAGSDGPSIDCGAIDRDAIEVVAGGAVVEVTLLDTYDGYTHTVGDREFEGSSTGCDIDLDISEFGPPELTVRVLAMAEDDFYAFFEESAAAEDGYTGVPGVGEAAFTYVAPASRTDLVAGLGGPVLVLSLGRGLDGPVPQSDEMVAIAELVTPAVG